MRPVGLQLVKIRLSCRIFLPLLTVQRRACLNRMNFINDSPQWQCKKKLGINICIWFLRPFNSSTRVFPKNSRTLHCVKKQLVITLNFRIHTTIYRKIVMFWVVVTCSLFQLILVGNRTHVSPQRATWKVQIELVQNSTLNWVDSH